MGGAAEADTQKRAAAEAAVDEVDAGMLVGLGTGTTAAYAISALGRRVSEGLRIRAVATSERTAAMARAVGIALVDFATLDAIDLAIDGVDEIDPELRAIKGGGGAMLREKIVAASAKRMIAIADASKPVARLGARPVPIEVLPFATAWVARRVREMGGAPTLRLARGKPWRTEQNNVVIDCRFTAIDDPATLAIALAAIPGALGHGLFPDEIDRLYVGTAEGVNHLDRKAGSGDRARRAEHP